jgi:hypothetical protein
VTSFTSTRHKYTSSSTALTILRTRKLRRSSPLPFNDTFDLTQTLRLDFDAKALTDLLVQEMASVLESPVSPPVGSDRRLQFLHRLLWHNGDKSARDAVHTAFRKESYGPTKGALNAL